MDVHVWMIFNIPWRNELGTKYSNAWWDLVLPVVTTVCCSLNLQDSEKKVIQKTSLGTYFLNKKYLRFYIAKIMGNAFLYSK